MNNAEKFAEVFGVDLPIRVQCSHPAIDDYCKSCLDMSSCDKWALAEYKEQETEDDL